MLKKPSNRFPMIGSRLNLPSFIFPMLETFRLIFSNTWKPAFASSRLCGQRTLILSATLFSLSALGADVTMTVSPPIISLGEAAQIKVEVRNAKRSQMPNFPRVDGLQFSGTSQSTQTSIVNGKIDKSISYTLTAYPQRTGEFTIGPFNYKVDGKTKQLTAKLKVVATSGDITATQSWNDVTFARITANRQQVYVQEPFELTLSIYSRTDVKLAGNINLQGLPDTGLSELDWKEIQNGKREQIDGVLYDVRQFKTPLKTMGSGTFEFAPTVTVQVAAPQQQQQRRRDPFGFGMFNSVQTIPVELAVAPATVEVLPLPTTGKPDGFSGAVGRFQFQVTAEPKDVSPGDPITLQMTIVGNGNYDRIQPPALPTDAPFRLFGDAVRKQGDNGVRFEQVISPRDATVTNIPPMDFSFFDSESRTYRTISSPAIPITVDASSNNTAQLFAAQETLTVAPADTPFATESDVQHMTGWLKEKWGQICPWLWTLPVALGIGVFIFLGQKIYHWRRKDTAWVRRQQAPKAARQGLKAANLALRNNEPEAFYEAIGNALSTYFGHRLNLPPGDVTPATVLTALEQAGADTTTLKSIFEKVEGARYGMGSENSIDTMRSLKTDLRKIFQSTKKINL